MSPKAQRRRLKATTGVAIGSWLVAPMLLFAQTVTPDQIADSLAKRDLTYAALFVAALAVGSTVYLTRLLFAAYQQNRGDYRDSTAAIDRLAEAMERRPCAMIEAGRARLVIEPDKGLAKAGDDKSHEQPERPDTA